jgi:hypothetical protein
MGKKRSVCRHLQVDGRYFGVYGRMHLEESV